MQRIAATALLAMSLLYGAIGSASDGRSGDGPEGNAARAASEQARAEAGRQLKAPAAEFTVVTIEPARWNDSSLGCSKPGKMATQVMTNGYTVLLERQGEHHQVNVAGSHAVMCDATARISGTASEPMSTRGLDRITALARRDLANKLRLDANNIRVANIEPRRWTDDDMNCSSGGGSPAGTDNAAQAAGSSVGYRLELSASGRTYTYHTDLRSVRACPP